jgi:hypothetical protein
MVLTPWYRNCRLGLPALRDDSVVHQYSRSMTEYDELVPGPADYVAKSFPGQTCSDQGHDSAPLVPWAWTLSRRGSRHHLLRWQCRRDECHPVGEVMQRATGGQQHYGWLGHHATATNKTCSGARQTSELAGLPRSGKCSYAALTFAGNMLISRSTRPAPAIGALTGRRSPAAAISSRPPVSVTR